METVRPRGLKAATLMMCLFNVVGVFVIDRHRMSIATFLVMYAIVAGLSFVVLWYFWVGKSWARWLVLVTSLLALFNLVWLPSSRTAERVLLVVEAAFATWLLYWLTTAEVRGFFHSGAPVDAA